MSKRPQKKDRKFISKAVEDHLSSVSFKNKTLENLYKNAFPNTLDTTVHYHNPGTKTEFPDTFIITGDIPAMWLRDSTCQVLHYIPLCKDDEGLRRLVLGVLHRQCKCIISDVYANAFKFSDEGGEWDDETFPEKSNLVWEFKYELDSLMYFFKLATKIFEAQNKGKEESENLEDKFFKSDIFVKAVEKVIKVLEDQRESSIIEVSHPKYKFQRLTKVPTDSLMLEGRGPPVKKCGLIKSMFRPSDDATTMAYLIPSNMMCCVELEKVSKLINHYDLDLNLAKKCISLAKEIREAISFHAIMTHPFTNQKVIAYEVDGFGNAYFMDDANLPSLLSIPQFGYLDSQDNLYKNTKEYILSALCNPYYFEGKFKGIGGPHIGLGYVWPMSVISQGFNAGSLGELKDCLEMLVAMCGERGLVCESVWMDDENIFTRSWFAWANSYFGSFVYWILNEKPFGLEL